MLPFLTLGRVSKNIFLEQCIADKRADISSLTMKLTNSYTPVHYAIHISVGWKEKKRATFVR